jgi:hypothetical protein
LKGAEDFLVTLEFDEFAGNAETLDNRPHLRIVEIVLYYTNRSAIQVEPGLNGKLTVGVNLSPVGMTVSRVWV